MCVCVYVCVPGLVLNTSEECLCLGESQLVSELGRSLCRVFVLLGTRLIYALLLCLLGFKLNSY